MAYDADIDRHDEARTASTSHPGRPGDPISEATTFGIILVGLFSVVLLGLGVEPSGSRPTRLHHRVLRHRSIRSGLSAGPRRTSSSAVRRGRLPADGGLRRAITGSISLDSVILFAIIFIWTPPHFWALALLRSDEYAKPPASR